MKNVIFNTKGGEKVRYWQTSHTKTWYENVQRESKFFFMFHLSVKFPQKNNWRSSINALFFFRGKTVGEVGKGGRIGR